MIRIAAIFSLLVAATMARAADADPNQRHRQEDSRPLPLEKAAAAMTLPEGFTATLFAGEPQVHQPIGFCNDHRGRLYVAENDAYPAQREEGNDKIVIFEDIDGDGRADKRTVFIDGLHYVTSVQVGLGGLWVIDCPNLLFFPLKDGLDMPAGPPVVVLDGFSSKGIHNLPNSMIWGPDGWLYGCNGTIFDVEIGPPGTPANQRTKMNRGIWRYHPTRKVFEKFAEGTANPWGLDYDEHGQLFMTNNVVAHLWHVVQGGHYPRVNWGSDSNPYSYTMLPTIADHLHWGGGDWTTSRGGEGIHSVAGGGHSHAGCMIYLGESFPAQYRGSLFMCNTHGHRINNDILQRKGSGFAAHHGKDFMLANDKWFKGVSIQYGPDGAIYFIDWSDTGECHDVDITDREHGRIFRVAYHGTKPVQLDLTKESDSRLVEMQTWNNEWYVRHARMLLQERGPKPEVRSVLQKMMQESKNPLHRLRAMWTLHACASLEREPLLGAVRDSDEYVRAWAIQLLSEGKQVPEPVLKIFTALAKTDLSPVVRLYLACAMQRVSPDSRRPVVEALLGHAEDSSDPNLPLMDWYAAEPLIGKNTSASVTLLARTRLPAVRELITRKMADAKK